MHVNDYEGDLRGIGTCRFRFRNTSQLMCQEFDKRYTSKRWATFNYNSSKTSGLGMTGAKSKEKKENKLLFKLFC